MARLIDFTQPGAIIGPGILNVGGFALRRGAGGASFDADAQAIIDAMSPTPDSARQTAINDFVVALKDSGVWAQLDFLHVYAAHSEQAALINWKNPGTHDATAVNAPTFTVDRGFAGDGSTSYLNTNFVPSTDGVNYTLNDASFGVYSRTNVANDNYQDMGALRADGTRRSDLIIRNTADTPRFRANQSVTTGTWPTVADSRGLFVTRRTASDALSFVRNGSVISTIDSASTALTDFAPFTGARNLAGTADLFSTRQYAAAFAAAAMTAQEQLDFFTDLETYLDVLGAGVVS